jgi:hypothetical protein
MHHWCEKYFSFGIPEAHLVAFGVFDPRASFSNTLPRFMTNTTRRTAVMSFSGLPSAALQSAAKSLGFNSYGGIS